MLYPRAKKVLPWVVSGALLGACGGRAQDERPGSPGEGNGSTTSEGESGGSGFGSASGGAASPSDGSGGDSVDPGQVSFNVWCMSDEEMADVFGDALGAGGAGPPNCPDLPTLVYSKSGCDMVFMWEEAIIAPGLVSMGRCCYAIEQMHCR